MSASWAADNPAARPVEFEHSDDDRIDLLRHELLDRGDRLRRIAVSVEVFDLPSLRMSFLGHGVDHLVGIDIRSGEGHNAYVEFILGHTDRGQRQRE